MKRENKNFIYNVIYQLFSFIIPLITAPYIARTLGANNIGIYSYTYSIVNYFMLATMLGINNYGSTSIAKVSSDKELVSKKFFSIYYLQLMVGILMLVTYNLLNIFVIKQYNTILFIDNIFLISAIIDINWFYFGIEKFKVTITRNIIIKLFSLILIFLFVKENNGLIYYVIIMNLANLLSQLYLWLHLRKKVIIVKVTFKEIFSNLKRCLVLFIPVIAYSIYRVMDKTMLGYFSGTLELGYYENAEKIISIPISIVTALGTVMLPNISKTINDKEKFMKKVYSSFELCFFLVIPMFFGLIAIGKDFSIIFYGDSFEKTGYIVRLLAPTFVFSAIANVIRTNYLIPLAKDKTYVTSTILGAIINFIFNIILIPKFGSYGACVGTILAEFVVMIYQIFSVRNDIDFKMVFKLLLKYMLTGIIMFIVIMVVAEFINSMILRLLAQVFIGAIIYFIFNYNYIIYDFLGKNKKSLTK